MRSNCARVALGLLAAVASGAVPMGADDSPPTELHYVAGHWTAWNPPVDLPPGTPVHIVVPGDTFWDLAASNLGNPYLWPQIWEKNRYVLDAHWIYPGDPIVLGVSVESLAPGELAAAGGAGSAPGGRGYPGGLDAAAPGGTAGLAGVPGDADVGLGGGTGAAGIGAEAAFDDPGLGAPGAGDLQGEEPNIESVAEGSGPPQALGFESDLYCSGFIGDLDEPLPIAIAGSEHEAHAPSLTGRASAGFARGTWGDIDTTKYGLEIGDIVYLDGGRGEGLQAGDLMTAVAPGGTVRHPLTRDTVGRLYSTLGRVRILAVEAESAIAEISHVCHPIPVGTRLTPFQPEPVPLGRRTAPRPANDPASAAALESAPVIIAARDGVISLAEDSLVFIDRGADSDSTPGDVYTIYRLNRGGRPPVPIGELAVLSVSRRASLARILSSRLPIFVGDRLERK
jgi:hypothetical protein